MNLIFFILHTSWIQILLAVFVGAISGFGGAAILALINHALHKSGTPDSDLLWGFGVVCLIVLLMRVASGILLVRLSQRAVSQLRMQLSCQILMSPVRLLESLGTHRLLATLTEDVPAITTAFVSLPMLCVQVATALGCLVYLGWLSWPLVFVIMGFIGFGIFMFRIQEARALRSLKSAREAHDDLHHHFRAMTEGAKELKLHRRRRSAFLSKRLQVAVSESARQFIAGMTTYTIAGSGSSLLLYLAIGLLLFGLPAIQEILPETMTGYILVMLYLMTPLEGIVAALPGFGRAGVSLKKVQDLGLSLSTHVSKSKLEEVLTTSDVLGAPCSREAVSLERLEFVGVTHQYQHEREGHDFCLGPIELVFHPGEVVFLVGGNGSGKTTLAMLLLGLYEPEGGEIRLNGESVTQEQREDYRQLFSAVFSDFYLFESFLGLDTAELEIQANEYLQQLELDHKVTVKNGRLSTLELSQGQRKRLALLTALLEDRPFYVFDEWAADQDPVFKKLFYTEILPELKAAGKTVLVITHDDQYFHVADRCIRMDFGQITHISEKSMVQV